MLKSIDPILNADVLYALRAMGHGDDLVLCDTNFPADAVARQTTASSLLFLAARPGPTDAGPRSATPGKSTFSEQCRRSRR